MVKNFKLFFVFIWKCAMKASERSLHIADGIFGGFGFVIVTAFFGWLGTKIQLPDLSRYQDITQKSIYFISILVMTWLLRFIIAPFFLWKESNENYNECLKTLKDHTKSLKEQTSEIQEERKEKSRRDRLFTELWTDALSSLDNFPTTVQGRNEAAEPYINKKLEERDENWRYDAKKRIYIDLGKEQKSKISLDTTTLQHLHEVINQVDGIKKEYLEKDKPLHTQLVQVQGYLTTIWKSMGGK